MQLIFFTTDDVESDYEDLKDKNPIKTTAKPGYDIPALIESEFAQLYEADYLLQSIDLNDLDAVLDYLYGSYHLFGIEEVKRLIDFIEARCEVQNG